MTRKEIDKYASLIITGGTQFIKNYFTSLLLSAYVMTLLFTISYVLESIYGAINTPIILQKIFGLAPLLSEINLTKILELIFIISFIITIAQEIIQYNNKKEEKKKKTYPYIIITAIFYLFIYIIPIITPLQQPPEQYTQNAILVYYFFTIPFGTTSIFMLLMYFYTKKKLTIQEDD